MAGSCSLQLHQIKNGADRGMARAEDGHELASVAAALLCQECRACRRRCDGHARFADRIEPVDAGGLGRPRCLKHRSPRRHARSRGPCHSDSASRSAHSRGLPISLYRTHRAPTASRERRCEWSFSRVRAASGSRYCATSSPRSDRLGLGRVPAPARSSARRPYRYCTSTVRTSEHVTIAGPHARLDASLEHDGLHVALEHMGCGCETHGTGADDGDTLWAIFYPSGDIEIYDKVSAAASALFARIEAHSASCSTPPQGNRPEPRMTCSWPGRSASCHRAPA